MGFTDVKSMSKFETSVSSRTLGLNGGLIYIRKQAQKLQGSYNTIRYSLHVIPFLPKDHQH